MERLILILAVLQLVGCQDQVQNFFDDRKDIKTAAGLQCSKLEGSSKDCLACYPCNHDVWRGRSKQNVQYLTFSYSNCTKEQLCCLKAEAFKSRSTDDDCGRHNPRGNPPGRRSGLRSVLEREYPWRAWVYSSSTNEPLCAATYVFFNVYALVTTASCLNNRQPGEIYVKFTKTQARPDQVRYVVVHPNFRTETGGNVDDIALLSLVQKPESRVNRVCLNNNKPLLGSSCVVVSDSETHVNSIVPQSNKCKADEVNVDNNVTCTYMVAGDYRPQLGAGLYCVEQHTNASMPRYALYGLYQGEIEKKQVGLFTSVEKFSNWILKTTNEIKGWIRQNL